MPVYKKKTLFQKDFHEAWRNDGQRSCDGNERWRPDSVHLLRFSWFGHFSFTFVLLPSWRTRRGRGRKNSGVWSYISNQTGSTERKINIRMEQHCKNTTKVNYSSFLLFQTTKSPDQHFYISNKESHKVHWVAVPELSHHMTSDLQLSNSTCSWGWKLQNSHYRATWVLADMLFTMMDRQRGSKSSGSEIGRDRVSWINIIFTVCMEERTKTVAQCRGYNPREDAVVRNSSHYRSIFTLKPLNMSSNIWAHDIQSN